MVLIECKHLLYLKPKLTVVIRSTSLEHKDTICITETEPKGTYCLFFSRYNTLEAIVVECTIGRKLRNIVFSALRAYKIEREHWSEIHANCTFFGGRVFRNRA